MYFHWSAVPFAIQEHWLSACWWFGIHSFLLGIPLCCGRCLWDSPSHYWYAYWLLWFCYLLLQLCFKILISHFFISKYFTYLTYVHLNVCLLSMRFTVTPLLLCFIFSFFPYFLVIVFYQDCKVDAIWNLLWFSIIFFILYIIFCYC